ncbi:MAG: chorismate synthase [Campylobacter sp.]|nr:chorismate synthase [Campylobacter sp.]
MNTFGTKLRLTTFGESHGSGIGGVIDGLPSGLRIDENFIQNELDKRKPGGEFASKRKESDILTIQSGVFGGISTGTPIGFFIANTNQKSKDYSNIKDIFRPSHADLTYEGKFGIRDYRGGGRSSARESVARVAGGALAQILLNEFGIEVKSGVFSVGEVGFDRAVNLKELDFNLDSEIFALNKELEQAMKDEIIKAKKSHDSVGASSITIIKNAPLGLGEVLYDKLDSRLGAGIMGINGVKAFEIGRGIESAKIWGSQNNDEISINGFLSNNSGGILGGISSGDTIYFRTYFKPTPSIFKAQKTVDKFGNETMFELKGRHDPCIGVRGSVVVTAMTRLIIADMLLLNATSNIANLKKIYG